ncbi:MAG: DNA repair and recombination protein RadA [Candidatus Nezhaarchaeales archaeon]
MEELLALGYRTVEAIAFTSPSTLAKDLGVSLEAAERCVKAAVESLSVKPVSLEELMRKQLDVERIHTGSRALDKLLGGGIESCMVTEFYGEYGAGKTQICHQLSVNAQLPKSMGGLSSKVAYIDPDGTFRPERVVRMSIELGLDPKATLNNILYFKPTNTYQQALAARKAVEEGVKLLIIDSVVSLFRIDGGMATGYRGLTQHLRMLRDLALSNRLAIVITNQAVARPELGVEVAPAGGFSVETSLTRVRLEKRVGGVRVAKLENSPYLAEGEALFKITEGGIRDVFKEEGYDYAE